MDKTETIDILNQAYFGQNRHEDAELNFMPNLLSEIDIFVDVGASLGPYTREAAGLLKKCVIFSIEADPLRFEQLEKNIDEWRCNDNEMIAVHGAASNATEILKFFTASTNTSGSLTSIEGRVSESEYVSVNAFKLDDLIDYKGMNILVKIDVEGAEYSVVEGMTQLINDNSVDLLIELHSWGDQRTDRYPHHLLTVMKQKGYRVAKTYEHYYFTKTKSIGRRKFYSAEIGFWWLKAKLRKIPLVRALKEFLQR